MIVVSSARRFFFLNLTQLYYMNYAMKLDDWNGTGESESEGVTEEDLRVLSDAVLVVVKGVTFHTHLWANVKSIISSALCLLDNIIGISREICQFKF